MVNILNYPDRCRGYFLDRIKYISNVKPVSLAGSKSNTCRRINLIMTHVHCFDNMTYGYQ